MTPEQPETLRVALVSDRQWTDVFGILGGLRDTLDFGYLEHWAKELGVLDLPQRARGGKQRT